MLTFQIHFMRANKKYENQFSAQKHSMIYVFPVFKFQTIWAKKNKSLMYLLSHSRCNLLYWNRNDLHVSFRILFENIMCVVVLLCCTFKLSIILLLYFEDLLKKTANVWLSPCWKICMNNFAPHVTLNRGSLFHKSVKQKHTW